MRDRFRRASRYLGIRGWVLLLCSYTWGLIGVAVVLGATSDRDSVWHTEIPDPVRFAGWVGAAVLAALAAVTQRPRLTVVAVVALSIMPVIRIMSYTWGWLMALIPGDPPGYGVGWYVAALHLPLLGLVIIAAHLPARSVLPRPVRTDVTPTEGDH